MNTASPSTTARPNDTSEKAFWQQRHPLLTRAAWLRRWICVALIALIATTSLLWMSQTLFPQVPLLGLGRTLSSKADLSVLIIGASSLFLFAVSSLGTDRRLLSPVIRIPVLRVFTLVLLAALGTLVVFDQHRLQPWVYHFAIVLFILAFAPPTKQFLWLRWLTISIYFWSAISKFDYTFFHGLGPVLLRGLVAAVGLDASGIAPETATKLAALFPLGELTVAVLLLIPRTRSFGLAGSLFMHSLLLLTLGPWGLNHEPGVLIWNAYFMGQNLLLFWLIPQIPPAPPAADSAEPLSEEHRKMATLVDRAEQTAWPRLTATVLAAVILLPALEPFGLVDHWPAWSVYAPSAERLTLWIDADAAEEKLPEELQRFLGPVNFLTEQQPLNIDRWSLEELSVPITPQERFKLGVAIGVVERFQLDSAATVIIDPRADRWTGQRDPARRVRLVGLAAMRAYTTDEYRLNALPRDPW